MSSPYCHKSNISISFLPVLSISLDRCLHKGTKVMAWVSFDIPLYKSDVIKSLKSNRVYILILLCLFDLLIAIEFSFQQVQVILYNLACYNKCILSVKRNFKKYVYVSMLLHASVEFSLHHGSYFSIYTTQVQ